MNLATCNFEVFFLGDQVVLVERVNHRLVVEVAYFIGDLERQEYHGLMLENFLRLARAKDKTQNIEN